jgi:glycosyltransferase involved in cell wall biosynthesis
MEPVNSKSEEKKVTAYGSLDGSVYGTARGWAFDPENPERSVAVELSVDGKPFETIAANIFRDDLMNAGMGDGRHAFSITLPREYLDGKVHIVSAKIAGTDVALSGSPREVAHADPPDQHHVPRTERQMARQAKKPKGQGVPDTVAAADSVLGGISVIIPTYNRGASMEETLRRCLEASLGAWGDTEVEFIVIDDGSTDDTSQRLARLASEVPNLRWASIPNSGQGQARNVGVGMASHELVLFQGDDIRPSCDNFYSHHVNAHRLMPSIGVAVLGKITWPDNANERVSFVMSHVQGRGENQFGFYSLIPYSWLDWRFFYTSNVSFKKSAVPDWTSSGFNKSFRAYGWEDAELAYRLSKQTQGGFRIIYVPAASATHHHQFNVSQFIERQISVGSMARTFLEFHPDVAKDIGISKLQRMLSSPRKDHAQCDHLISMIEGIKAWPKVIEQRYQLGSQNWHADLLTAVFELCYLQGFVISHENPNANYPAAYTYILERFQERMATAASFEVFGRFPSFTLT